MFYLNLTEGGTGHLKVGQARGWGSGPQLNFITLMQPTSSCANVWQCILQTQGREQALNVRVACRRAGRQGDR